MLVKKKGARSLNQVASDSVDMNRTRVGYHVLARAHVSKSSLPVRRMPEMPSQFWCESPTCVPHFWARGENIKQTRTSYNKTTPSRRTQICPSDMGHAVIIFVRINKNARSRHLYTRKDAHANGFFGGRAVEKGGRTQRLHLSRNYFVRRWASVLVSYALNFFLPCLWKNYVMAHQEWNQMSENSVRSTCAWLCSLSVIKYKQKVYTRSVAHWISADCGLRRSPLLEVLALCARHCVRSNLIVWIHTSANNWYFMFVC